MKLSDLSVEGARSAIDACEVLYRRLGGRFSLSFKRRIVPMNLRRIPLSNRVLFILQVDVTVDESMTFSGMQQIIGMNPTNSQDGDGPPTPNDSYIGFIHAMPAYRWKGSDMVELALGIARSLGVLRTFLYDGTNMACDDDEGSGFDLSMIMLLTRQVSFYGRYGFQPIAEMLWDHAALTSGHPVDDMCRSLRALKKVRVASFVRYLRSMLSVMDPSTDQARKAFRLVHEDVLFGVPHLNPLKHSAMTTSLPVRVNLMHRLLTAFASVPGSSLLFALFEGSGISCRTKSDFLELHGLSYLTLRLGLKGSGSKAQPGDVNWPPWSQLTTVTKIRQMRWAANVNADPLLQRVETMCKT